MGCREAPDRALDGNHEVAAEDGRNPKIPKKAHDEDAAEEDGEGVHVHALHEVVRLEGGETRFGPVFVGDEPAAPPSWGWIHLQEQLQRLLHETFLILSSARIPRKGFPAVAYCP